MKIKSILSLAAAVATMATIAATSTPKGFTDDLDAALAEAKTSGKFVYACFSGSDWCGWCKKLEKEVFSDKECDFVGSLKNDYIFVFIDNPRDKSLLSEKAKEMNPKQTEKYKVQGFPTALILTGDGKEVEQTGYRRGGAKEYVKFLQELRKDGADKRIAKREQEKAEAAKKEAQAKTINEKYFKSVEEKLQTAMEPLKGKPTPEVMLKVADEMDKYKKEIEAIKFADADKEIGVEMQEQIAAQLERFAKMIRSAAERGKAKKAEKKAEKPSETK